MLALLRRDIRLGIRAGGGTLVGVLFFLAVVAVVPFGVGPDLNLLARIGPAILWIGALLASLLGLDRLFQADREDGSLDLLILADQRHLLAVTIFVKCAAHWRWSSPRRCWASS
jgi:heme exporter protein B